MEPTASLELFTPHHFTILHTYITCCYGYSWYIVSGLGGRINYAEKKRE